MFQIKEKKNLLKKDSKPNLLKSALGIAAMIQNKNGGLSKKGNADLENNKYNSNKKCNCLNKKRIRKEEMCWL